MKNEKLDELVANGTLNFYSMANLDENGNIGKGKFRNTERLVLEFPNGQTLTIDAFCSGCLENTTLSLS